MTVTKLIALLQKLPPEAEVMTFDADAEAYEPVTGAVYGNETVELQTDSND